MEMDVGGSARRLSGETGCVGVLDIAGARVEQVEHRRLHTHSAQLVPSAGVHQRRGRGAYAVVLHERVRPEGRTRSAPNGPVLRGAQVAPAARTFSSAPGR